MQRIALTISALLLALTFVPAQAQPYPYPAYTRYCMDTSFSYTGTIPVCRYYTFEQCQEARVRQTERCFLNPAFANEGPRRYRRGG